MEAKNLKREYASSLFPQLAYAEKENIFLLEPKSLGFGFVCDPIYSMDSSTGDRLNVLLNQDWPVNTIVQFSLWSSPDIESFLYSYDQISMKGNETLHRLRPEAVEYYRKKTQEPLSPAQGPLKIKDLQLIITVRIPIKNNTPTEKEMGQVKVLRESVAQSLETGSIYGEPMTAPALVRIMSVMLNQKPESSWCRHPRQTYDESEILRDQFLDLILIFPLTRRA